MGRIDFTELKRLREAARKQAALGNGRPRARITVHMGTCGIASGAQRVLDGLRREIEQDAVEGVAVSTSGCAGLCSREPMATVEVAGELPVKYADLDVGRMRRILREHVLEGKVVTDCALAVGDERRAGEITGAQDQTGLGGRDGRAQAAALPGMDELDFFKHQALIALRNRGRIDPEAIRDCIREGGYQALAKAVAEMTPEAVIEEVKRAGLRGRGGAGFTTGMKWQLCRSAPGEEKYIVCNGDEGDPGAFMDRSLLEADPHAVLEGMIIGAYAMGVHEGFFYIRDEYPLALKRVGNAIEQARDHGLLGENILGSGFSFDVEVIRGGGAFVCGEETALMASIEGYVGRPRQRPPYPVQSGLWGKPTNINNVETWANVAPIILRGGDWYASIGTEKSKGTKVFSLVGNVVNSGLLEVPMGISLRRIVCEIGGGVPEGKKLKAVQTGGPSGGCIPERLLDLPVDYEKLTEVGAIMGSGGMIVIDDSVCIVNLAHYFLSFTQSESCGKCTPCRAGTWQMKRILERIMEGQSSERDLERLESLAHTVKVSSLCGLGQTAPNPVLSTLQHFREEYEAHVRDRHCPALVCKSMIRYRIEGSLCNGCQVCARQCPVEAITGVKNEVHDLDSEKCTKCGFCTEVCQFDAVLKEPVRAAS